MIKIRSTLLWLLIMVPLMAAAGTQDETANLTDLSLPELIYDSSEYFSDIQSANLDGLLERIGDSRLVLLGEASHGTAEFYDMRARITRELIEKKGFTIIALEANWPDAESIDFYIRGFGPNPLFYQGIFSNSGTSDFPSWMWVNQPILSLVNWLKDYNRSIDSPEHAVGFYGLDIYNMSGSMQAVLNYLQNVDPYMADVARGAYACLMPWVKDPSIYSRVIQSTVFRGCEFEVLAVLQNLFDKRAFYWHVDGPGFFSAVQNARLVSSAEGFYRGLYDASSNTWNLRDQHMFDTLRALLNYRGQTSKAVIWAHNLHTGDARAMQMSKRGEFNLGQRVRETFGDSAYLIGFGTHHGTVAAASKWGGSMQVMQVPPSHHDSYEHLFHDIKTDNFLLPLLNTKMANTRMRHTKIHNPVQDIMRQKLLSQKLQRAIGVTYDPEFDTKKNYSYVSLPRQFDEYIWFDETQAVKPLIKNTQ